MSTKIALGIWMAGLLGLLGGNDVAPPQKHLLASSERSLQIQPRAIHSGESAVLSWCNKNSEEILLYETTEPLGAFWTVSLRLIGRFPSKGSLRVWPRLNSIYVISCADVGTSCGESISVTVR